MPNLDNLRVVLVNTSHPGNIGASARAMKNMGVEHLSLVQPKKFPDGVAVGRAASATDILEKAVVTDSLQEAIAGCGLVVGASARNRRIPWPVVEPRECGQKVIAELSRAKVALLFGREDRGLTNEELQLCHFHVHIPACEGYSSLNLAASVMVICYEIRMALLSLEGSSTPVDKPEMDNWDMELATAGDMENFLEHLEKVMIDLKFHDPKNPRHLMVRLRRLYSRIRPDKMELNILRGILSSTEYKIGTKQYKKPD